MEERENIIKEFKNNPILKFLVLTTGLISKVYTLIKISKVFIFKRELLSIMALSLKIDALKTVLV